MQYLLFVLLAPVSAVILFFTLASVWRRRNTPGALILFYYLSMAAGFLIGNTLELINPTAEGTLFWARINYIFIGFIPPAWLAYALYFTGRSKLLEPQRFWLFAVDPLLTVFFAQFSNTTDLIWKSYTFDPVLSGRFLVMRVLEHGQWFWVHAIYSYVLMIAGAILIGREHFFARTVYRRQSTWTIVGALLPLLVNAIYIFKVIPGLTKDFSPIAYALSGVFFYLGINRYRLLDLMPIAHHLLVDMLPDGVLVLDSQMRIVDFNPAARSILNLPEPDPIGLPVEEVWQEGRAWLGFPPPAGALDAMPSRAAWANLPTRPDVLHVERNGQKRSYSMLLTPVTVRGRSAPWRGKTGQNGWLLLLSDVTRRVDAERALSEVNGQLRDLNEALEARVLARTQALSQRAGELEALARVSSELRKASGMNELLGILVEETAAMLSADSGAIFMVEGDALVLHARKGQAMFSMRHDLRHPRTADPLWEVVDTGQMQLIDAAKWAGRDGAALRNDGVEEPAPVGLFDRLVENNVALILSPFRATNTTLGLLALSFTTRPPSPGHTGGAADAEPYSHPFVRPLQAISEMAGNALQRIRTMENLEALVQARTRNLTVLYEVTATANQYLDPPELLQHVLGIVLDQMHLPAALVHLVDETGSLSLVASAGLSSSDVQRLPPARDPAAPWQLVIEQPNLLVQPTLATPITAGEKWLTACVCLPVQAKGIPLGVMTALGENISRFSAEEIALLAAIADNTAVAVERAQLRLRARDAAVMEERQRLARDLHDSVTQSLYSLVLFAEAGGDSLSGGDAEKTAHHLARLRDTAQQALREMRLLIFELRPQVLRREGLAGALRQRLDAVERRAGIEAHLKIRQDAPLPDEVETGLYGVALEALNNVIKHAHASQVTVRLCAGYPQTVLDMPENPALAVAQQSLRAPLQVELEITDNGQGMGTGEINVPAGGPTSRDTGNLTLPEGGVGLASMRERVAALGGALSIRSSQGHGTTILVILQLSETSNDEP